MPRQTGDGNYSLRERRLIAERKAVEAELKAANAKIKAKDAKIAELRDKLR